MVRFPDDIPNELFNKIYNQIFAFALKILKDRHRAEDVTQEVFYRILKILRGTDKTYESLDEFVHVLFKIARNYIIDLFRRDKRYYDIMSEDNKYVINCLDRFYNQTLYPEHNVQNDELRQALIEAIQQLPVRTQKILELRFHKGLKTKEIAEILEMTDGAVRQVLTQAFASLRKNTKLLQLYQEK